MRGTLRLQEFGFGQLHLAKDAAAALQEQEFGFGQLHLAKDAAAALQEQRPFRCQADGARRAVEQTNPQAFFQPRDGLADCRRRDAQLLPGRSEAAGLPRAYEEVKRTKIFHLYPSINDVYVTYIVHCSLFFFCW